jgi:hypothetical protein
MLTLREVTMRAVLAALLLASVLPAAAADSKDSQTPYLDPCQCVRGTPIPRNRAPANINDPVGTTIHGAAPKPTEQAQDPYGAGKPLPRIYDPATIIRGEPPKRPETEKPDRPIGMG